MYKAKRILTSISPEELDQYLENGWFRMKQQVFTTEFLQMGLDFFDAIWLRQDLPRFQLSKWFHKMKRNTRFKVEVSDLNLTSEHELLYQAYRETKTEGFPESLESILYGDSTENIFQTKQINIYEKQDLIASGFFDLGQNSAAGIVSYFEPRYRNFSMGKFATMLAYEYCQQHGFHYFYPGYFAPGNSNFDYKLNFDPQSLEYLDTRIQSWRPIENYKDTESPIEIVQQKLAQLSEQLDSQGLRVYHVYNLYFAFTETSRFGQSQCIDDWSIRRSVQAIRHNLRSPF
jgi:arginine-tRNA-protein transferase